MASPVKDPSGDVEGASPPRLNRGPSAGPGNRLALIAAAREIFSADGISAPLSAVARRAGVGQGSLYRHFPDRTALAVAVFEENLAELRTLVDDSDIGLDDLLDRLIAQVLVSTSFIDMISSRADDPRVAHLERLVHDVLEIVLEREQAAGRIGAHVSTDDVLLAVSMLVGVLALREPAVRPELARRAWGLFHQAFAPR